MIKDLIKKVLSHSDLTRDEARTGMDEIMNGRASPAQIAGFLVALQTKGETIDEVAGFVESMRAHAVKIRVKDAKTVDGCGTGGDDSHSFNISTAAALVVASAGITVAKHGNRSVSSKCGSADLLEVAGGNVDPGPERVKESIDEMGFGFLFAPRFHPAMRHAAVPRKELGVRTVFNVLGPMTNPAGVKRQVIGVFDPAVMRLMIEVMKMTGSERRIMAHSHEGHDEFSVSSPTDYLELKDGKITEHTITPNQLGIEPHPPGSVEGGDSVTNLSILRKLLGGGPGAIRDAVLVNAGVMVYLADRAETIREGINIAGQALDSGRTRELLDNWINFTNR
jgi:anthranilate phosphoribosyltransferase